MSRMSKEARETAKRIDKDIRKKYGVGMNIPKKDLTFKYNLYPTMANIVWVALRELGYEEHSRYFVILTAP